MTPSASVLTLSATDLAPIKDTIVSNVPVLLGVGVAVLAIMAGISLIPRVFYKFF